MGDWYAEILVPRKNLMSEQIIKFAMIGFTGILFVGGFLIHPFCLIGAMVMCLVDYFVFPRFKVEYEYRYIDGQFDIDVIYSKMKRKRKETLDLNSVEIIAPIGSKHLEPFQFDYKVVDYTSREEDAKPYVFVVPDKKLKYHLEIDDEKVLQDLSYRKPRNFFRE